MQAIDQVIQVLLANKRLEIELICSLFFTLFLIGLIPAIVLLSLQKLLDRSRALIRFILVSTASLILLNYIGLVLFYLTQIDFADPAEANVVAVSWLFQNGQPLYPALDAAARYINNYGAFSYLIHGLFLRLLSPSFFSAKIGGCLAGLSSLALIFLLLKRQLNWQSATIGSACACLGFLAQTSASGLVASSFWVRPDSYLLFFTTLGLFVVTQGTRSTAMLGSAIALGISTNLKITAFLHFVPIYVLLIYRFGFLSTLASIIGSTVISALPYLLPQISLANFWVWLQQVRQKGINPDQIPKNLLWSGFMALPIAIALLQFITHRSQSSKRLIGKYTLYVLALIACICVNAFISATRGALENNMLPFIPLFVYLAGTLLQKHSSDEKTVNLNLSKIIASIILGAAFAFVVSICLAVYSTEIRFVTRLAIAPGHAAVADLEQFMNTHPNTTIALGYGAGSYQLSTYRPKLVFAGNPYLLDSASLMEMQAAGLINTPASTLTALKTCQTQIWLIPKNNQPFQVYSYYPPLQKLFSDEFRKTFLETYDRQSQTQFYDAWICKK